MTELEGTGEPARPACESSDWIQDSYSQVSLLRFPCENHMQISLGLVPTEITSHHPMENYFFFFFTQKLELAESWNSRSLKIYFTHSIKLYALEMLSDKFP